VAAVLGVLAGAAAKAADESGLSWAGTLGPDPVARVLAVALIGRFAPTWRAAGPAVRLLDVRHRYVGRTAGRPVS
jgi:hypothetical protein